MSDTGRVAIVTGGAGELGLAIAAHLAAGGMRIALVDVSEAVVARASELAPDGAAIGLVCDVTRPEDAERATAAAEERLGPPHALVTCAGIAPIAPVLEMSAEDWRRTLAVNLDGTFWFCQCAGRAMAARRAGRIVNITSVSGERAGYGRAAYGAAKAAVIQLTRQLAVELGPFGVTCNAVGPGPVDTELARRAHSPQMRADYLRSIPLARYGEPQEIAAAVGFLVSDAAGYVNGQTLFVDGGFTVAGVAVETAQAAARKG